MRQLSVAALFAALVFTAPSVHADIIPPPAPSEKDDDGCAGGPASALPVALGLAGLALAVRRRRA